MPCGCGHLTALRGIPIPLAGKLARETGADKKARGFSNWRFDKGYLDFALL
jgi:hypothetical protein